jgi:hypothetical protein
MLILLLAAGTADAQPSAGGYLKTLFIQSESLIDEKPFWLDVSRGRLQLAWASGNLRGELWSDLEMQAGTFFDTQDALFLDATDPEVLIDLDGELSSGSRHRLIARVFRGTVSWYGNRISVVAGRQRVAWGTGFVWNPTDLLNPLAPTAIERTEKGAVDAVFVTLPTGALSAVEVVAAPVRDSGRHRYAARYRGHTGEYDWTVMAGRFAEDWAFGVDFAGYVRNSALRGEAALRGGALRAVINADYTFGSGLYVLVEAYHNGAGAQSRTRYSSVDLQAATFTGLARWYTAASTAYPVSPLVSASGYVLANLVDGSMLLGPGIQWSVSENLTATLGVYGFVGRPDSEYGSLSTTGFLQLQAYF